MHIWRQSEIENPPKSKLQWIQCRFADSNARASQRHYEGQSPATFVRKLFETSWADASPWGLQIAKNRFYLFMYTLGFDVGSIYVLGALKLWWPCCEILKASIRLRLDCPR